MGSPPFKILWIILKIDKEGTQTVGPKDKIVDNNAQGFIFERWYRQIICIENRRGEEKMAALKIAWNQQFEDWRNTQKEMYKKD